MKRLGLFVGVLTALAMLSPGSVLAANALCSSDAPKEVLQSDVCKNQNADPIAGPGGIISDVTNVIALVAGIIAVVMIIYGGFTYVTSSGDSSKIQEAKKTIVWSLVGLIIIALARSIILFVISKI